MRSALAMAALACVIFTGACRQRNQGTPMNTPQPSAAWRFPCEPTSESDLLAASHLFLFTILKQTPSAWSAGADGLERRVLDMKLRLDGVLKGEIDLDPGKEFPFRVEQVREPGGAVSDYHGFWSHFESAEGASYLALASGPTKEASDLLSEPAIKDIVPAAKRSEFDFAEAEEKRLSPGPVTAKMLATLAQNIAPKKADLGVLAAGYALARLGEGDMREGPIVAALLQVITDPATSHDLRGALARGLGDKALDQGATPLQRAAIARGLFRLAALPQARDAFELLASGELSNLVFAEEGPDLKVADVVPDPAERRAFASLLLSFEDERSEALAAWLAKP